MGVIIAKSVNEACDVLAENPATTVLAGGTDLMVQVNRGAKSLESVLDLSRILELKKWSIEGSEIVLGAGISYLIFNGKAINLYIKLNYLFF